MTSVPQDATIPPILGNKPDMQWNSEHDNMQLVCDKQWHVHCLTQTLWLVLSYCRISSV